MCIYVYSLYITFSFLCIIFYFYLDFFKILLLIFNLYPIVSICINDISSFITNIEKNNLKIKIEYHKLAEVAGATPNFQIHSRTVQLNNNKKSYINNSPLVSAQVCVQQIIG